MKTVRIIGASVLLLVLGAVAPAYAQQEQDAKPPKQEQRAKPERQEQQSETQQNRQRQQQQQHAYRSSKQERGQQQVAWQDHRARDWRSEHRNWQERGGYSG